MLPTRPEMTPTRRSLYAITACVILLTILACANRREEIRGEPGEEATFVHDGIEREYILYLPEDLPANAPLIVALHGGGSKAKNAQNYYRFNVIAEREGAAALYPQGIDNGWNDGRDRPDKSELAQTVDDVGFLKALIEQTIEDHDLGPDRVLITGASNGGHMTTRMVCAHAEMFAVAAPVIASFPKSLHAECAPSAKVPMLIIKGTQDPLIPYEGGPIAMNRGEALPTSEEIAFWTEHLGCAPTPSSTTRADAEAGDEISTRGDFYEDGCAAAPLHVYTIEGGGHTWPGNTVQYAPAFIIGEPSEDIDASETIWAFFESHGLITMD